jgi:hypothetical protein
VLRRSIVFLPELKAEGDHHLLQHNAQVHRLCDLKHSSLVRGC